MLTLNKKRFFTVFSLVAIFSAFLVATLSPTPAMADVKDTPYLNEVYNDDLYKDLSAHQHYWWLYSCLQNVNIDKVTESEVDGWDFFEGSGMISGLGAMYTASEDTGAYRQCNDANMVKTAFNYLGFKNSREAFCTIPGAQYKEGGDDSSDYDDCIAGAGDGNWDNNDEDRNDIMAWYKSDVEAKKPTLTDQGRYMRAMASLVNGCDVQFSSNKLYDSSGDVPGADDGSDGTKYAVPVVVKQNGNYKVKYVLGIGIPGDRSVMIAAASGGAAGSYGPTQTADCNQVVNAARDTASVYAAFITRAGATNVSDGELQQDENPSDSDSSTTCAVDGIGWIVCPVVTFLSKLNDAAFGFLNNFLNVPPDVFSDPATKKAWEAFRNIANIAFVIAFLIIIYSQITGRGVTNYGIKKLMPKIIIAAILVNVSFYICAAMVDLSNIVGAALYDLLKGMNIGADTGAGGVGSTIWATAGAVILAGTAVIGLLALIIFAPTSLLAFALVIMILIARQAFVVLLIVISPLAFVAYLLPNTEQWFKKWWKSLVAMLMVFPIIALVFGASSLASDILIRVSEDGAGGGDDNQLMKIVGAAVLAIPLFAVPLLLKGAMSAAGSIGAKVAGLQGGLNKASGRRAREGFARQGKSLEARMASAEGNGLRARTARRVGGYRTRRDFRRKASETEAHRLQEEALTDHVLDNPQRYNDRQVAQATAQANRAYEEEVKSADTRLQAQLSHAEILAASASGQHNGRQLNEHERDAAIRYTMDRGNFEERQAAVSGVGSMTRSQRKSLVGGMRAKGETEIYGNQALATLEATHLLEGETGIDAAAAAAVLEAGVTQKINDGGMSAETVTKDHRVARYVAGVITAPGTSVTSTARDDLHDDIDSYASNNPQSWTKLDKATRDHASSI